MEGRDGLNSRDAKLSNGEMMEDSRNNSGFDTISDTFGCCILDDEFEQLFDRVRVTEICEGNEHFAEGRREDSVVVFGREIDEEISDAGAEAGEKLIANTERASSWIKSRDVDSKFFNDVENARNVFDVFRVENKIDKKDEVDDIVGALLEEAGGVVFDGVTKELLEARVENSVGEFVVVLPENR